MYMIFHNDIATIVNATNIRKNPGAVHFGVQDIGWQALGPAAAFTVLSTAVVAVRWYTRCRLARCLGLDDYVIHLSVLLSWAMTAIIGVEVHHGIGVYDKDDPAAVVAKLVVVNNNIWIVLVNITKASILFQYLRVFNSAVIRRLCLVLLVLLLPAAAWGVFGGTFLCSPTTKLWNPQLTGHCMNAENYWYSVAGIDIGLDFLILLLPIPALSNLHLPRKQKIGLLLVFLLGFFVCIVSIIRVVSVLVTSLDDDFVASGVWAIIWSAVEANVGIVCASLLALKPLAIKLFPKLMDETEPPRHSVRLPMIEAGVWPGESDEAKLTMPPSSTNLSKDDSDGTRPSTARTARMSSQHSSWSPVRLSQVENIRVVEAEDEPPWGRARDRMSLFDILREDVVEARARIDGTRVQRRDSSFREHL